MKARDQSHAQTLPLEAFASQESEPAGAVILPRTSSLAGDWIRMWSPAFLSLSLTPLASHLYEAINTLFCGRPFVNYYLLSRRYSVTAAQSELGPNYGNYSHTSCPVDYRRHSQDLGTQVMGFARRVNNEVIPRRSVIVSLLGDGCAIRARVPI